MNDELSLAWDFIENTGTHLFLTGKAGTGKTTFLRRLKEGSPKRMVVLAPTGIAAINAGGMTIHSFFQLPFAPFVPETSFSSSGNASYGFRFGKEKVRIIRSTDLIVIDEISMVRADLLDAVDNVLRRYRERGKPFGGVQLLMIGDLQQLAPVVKEEDWQMLKDYYDTPYFFSSRALRQTEYCTIELKTVYRQSDRHFLDILNRIRENRCDRKLLDDLNSRYIPDFQPKKEDGYIRLVTHNHQARLINDDELSRLSGEPFTFTAQIEGRFPEYSYPTEENLVLKQGAQVMFVKNDTSGERRYFNGMLGEVTEVSDDGIEVRARDSGDVFLLQKEEWTNARYVLDPETREITEEVDGVFRQYPVKLAWAITIHKSQGLTFDKAIIDASASFAHGQAYVALSRCRTLEGMVLSAPLASRSVISDRAVEDFTEHARQSRPDSGRLMSLKRAYFLDLLDGLFGFGAVLKAMKRYVYLADEHFFKVYPQQVRQYKDALAEFTARVMDVAAKFKVQYTRLAGASDDYDKDPVLQDRIRSGAVYFRERVEAAAAVFSDAAVDSDSKEAKRKLRESAGELAASLDMKASLLEYVVSEGFHTEAYLKRKAVLSIDAGSSARKKPGASKGAVQEGRSAPGAGKKAEVPADILHPELYRRLVAWRNSEASAQGVPVYVVIRQKAILGIANLLPSDKYALSRIPYLGKAGVEKYGDALLDMVKEYIENQETGTGAAGQP